MPNVETNPLKQVENLNMERQRLLFNTTKYKEAIEDQVSDLKDNAIRFGIQGLIFGGVALGTYFLVRAFSKKEKSEKKSKGEVSDPKMGFASSIFASIQGYIASFILSIAREKIIEYLENKLIKPKHESSKGNTSQAGL
jgi:hypothetical protein